MNSYEIIAQEVKKFWNKTYPQDVVAFFYQKYEHETNWVWREEVVECNGSDDYENMTFLNDFCEGQTCVRNVTIVSLSEVIASYRIDELSDRVVNYRKVHYGKWIDVTQYCGEFMCSICRETCVTNRYKYCPHCGAKMDKDKEVL